MTHQVWVTVARDEGSALRAAVLAASARNVNSNIPKGVLFNPNRISSGARRLLEHYFDSLIPIGEGDGDDLLDDDVTLSWTRLAGSKLPFVTRAALIPPASLFTANADQDLFPPTTSDDRRSRSSRSTTTALLLRPAMSNNSAAAAGASAAAATIVILSQQGRRPGPPSPPDHPEEEGNNKVDGDDVCAAAPFYAAVDLAAAAGGGGGGGDDMIVPPTTLTPSSSSAASGGGLVEDDCWIRVVSFIENQQPSSGSSPPLLPPLEDITEEALLLMMAGDTLGQVEKALLRAWTLVRDQVLSTNDGEPPSHPLSIPSDAIAILGQSCRFPGGAHSPSQYWNLLSTGTDCITAVPTHRWPSAIGEEYRSVPAGFLTCPVDTFDGRFFGISPADLIHTDPQQRLLMEVTWEALEDAGVDTRALVGSKTGAFVGSWTSDYRDLINGKDVDSTELGEFHRLYMGNSLGGTGGRLSYLLGITGPNVATESGCSSGMAAVYLAVEALRAKRCDLAIAGGVNLLLHPFKRKHMRSIVSQDGRCKTFDETADGFGRGEGVASLVLSRYSTAVRCNYPILALITGTGMAQEGTSRSFGTPTASVQESAMKAALSDAGIRPGQVSYVEAHGTGTMVGDPVEVAAIAAAYGDPGRMGKLVIGSGKTNIGHTESCSGLAGIIKVVLSMKHGTIPPHINLNNLNPHVHLDDVPAVVPVKAMEWTSSGGSGNGTGPRMAGVSSFGITGTDCHVILREAPEQKPAIVLLPPGRCPPLATLPLSSKSEAHLDALLAAYVEFLSSSTNHSIHTVCRLAGSSRAQFSYRAAFTGASREEIKSKIEKHLLSSSGLRRHTPESKSRLAFVFTGQGAQYWKMGEELYACAPVFKLHYDRAAKLIQNETQLDFKSIVMTSGGETDCLSTGDPVLSQCSTFILEYALAQYLMYVGVVPEVVAGHSLGEFAALVTAGVLHLKQAAKLVAVRARLVKERCCTGTGAGGGKMLAIKAGVEKVKLLIKQFTVASSSGGDSVWVDVAGVNSPDQTVVAGDAPTIDKFTQFLSSSSSENIKSTEVRSGGAAYHSRAMDLIKDEYQQVLHDVLQVNNSNRKMAAQSPIQFVSSVTGKVVVESSQLTPEYFLRHSRDPVEWTRAVGTIVSDLGVRTFIEVGPHPVLLPLVVACAAGEEQLTVIPILRRNEAAQSWRSMSEALTKVWTATGTDIHWGRVNNSGGGQEDNNKMTPGDLPKQPFIRKSFWYSDSNNDDDPMMNKSGSGPLLHPLLGTAVLNATSTALYDSRVSVDRCPYLTDHRIGDRVVFPGAAFLEMTLAAGCAATSTTATSGTHRVSLPLNSVEVRDLVISAPLGVDTPRWLQTSVKTTTEQGDISVAVHSYQGGSSKKWMKHAGATFVPLPMSHDLKLGFDPVGLLLKGEEPEAEAGSGADGDAEKFYGELAERGLVFGDSFRSLKQVRRVTCGGGGDKDDGGLDGHLVEIKAPAEGEDEDQLRDHLVHPIVLDALIQALMVHKFNTDKTTSGAISSEDGDQDKAAQAQALFVPVMIESVVVCRSTGGGSGGLTFPLRAFAYSSGNGGGNSSSPSSVVLFDSSGCVVCVMRGVQMVETSVTAILKSLDLQKSTALTLPSMYEEVWRGKLGGLKQRTNLGELARDELFEEAMRGKMAVHNEVDDEVRRGMTLRNKLVGVYAAKAIHDLLNKGDNKEKIKDNKITVSGLISSCGVLKSHERFVRRLLHILQEDGALVRTSCTTTAEEEEEETWSMDPEVFPSSASMTSDLGAILGEIGAEEDVRVMNSTGSVLADILTGRTSALPILFPDSSGGDGATTDSPPSAEKFYTTTPLLRFGGYSCLREMLEEVFGFHSTQMSEESRGIVRILEIGAGTGSSTSIFLSVMDALAVKYVYTFTDVSPAFFLRARTTYEGKRMIYKTLNIEEDPLGQGFAPAHYDFVFASNVLHATRDLRESLRHARSLLRPDGGMLVLVETLEKVRDIDVVFGVLEGFWKFKDTGDVRVEGHPMVGGAVWERLIMEEGMGVDKVSVFPAYAGYGGGVLARTSSGSGSSGSSGSRQLSGGVAPPQEQNKLITDDVAVTIIKNWWVVVVGEESSATTAAGTGMVRLLQGVGRGVVLVTATAGQSPPPTSAAQKLMVAPPGDKAAMSAVFKMMREESLLLEGVLYMRSSTSDSISSSPLSTSLDFLSLAQCLLEEKNKVRLIVVTWGVMPVDPDLQDPAPDLSSSVLWGMARTLRAEHSNLFVRCVDLDQCSGDDTITPTTSSKKKNSEEGHDLQQQQLLSLLEECFVEGDGEYQVGYRGATRHVLRFVSSSPSLGPPLPLPPSNRFALVLPKTRNIADLSFCATGKPILEETQVEIKVSVIGLNFRDIFVVLKPDPVFDSFNTVGLEFSGVVTAVGRSVKKVKIGDHVIGCNFKGDALPSHAIAEEDVVVPMLNGMTFHEAATVPAAFGTAYFCLITVAKLGKGERVLIHCGSGGVGLFAIQVAVAVGAEVVATAGSKRKRNFLRRSLGVKHVFHSRNCTYGDEIEKIFGEGAVDVVLNSLTSPGFKEASLRVVTKKGGGRFVEMSKMAVWKGEEVAALRPDVRYEVVDLTEVSRETWDSVWENLFKFTDAGHIKPIPYVSFDVGHIREALTFMQKARHIGKVLISMPNQQVQMQVDGDSGGGGSDLIKGPPQGAISLSSRPLMFNEFSTYLITGGLGGIGLEVARWMSGSGARHIVLVSRRGPSETSARIVNELVGRGVNVVVKSCDVGDRKELEALLSWIKQNLPPLRGVMHCAGSLADATYSNQTEEKYRTALQGKALGAWHLHELTLNHYRLEHFVLFSSIVALFGPIGLSNYACANTFLDALAHYRHSLGLPAQSVNWGQWGEVGAAANISIVALRPFTPAQGIAALEETMRGGRHGGRGGGVQSCVLEVDFASVRKLTGGQAGNYLEEIKQDGDNGGGQQIAFNVKMERFWDEYRAVEEGEEQLSVLKSYVEMILRQILKFDEDDVIDELQGFSEMGMDSLMMLEMKNFVQTMLGSHFTINVGVMSELTNVAKLVDYLHKSIKEMDDNSASSGASCDNQDHSTFSDALVAVINADMELGEDISACAEGSKPAVPRGSVRTVLLTGGTGKFGPHLLSALLKSESPRLEKVYVLVRPRVNVSVRDRLLKALGEVLGGDEQVDLSRVEVISGDVTEGRFGLYNPVYEELAETVDAVVHCAVKGNLMDPYMTNQGLSAGGGASTTTTTDMRTSNVVGARHVIKFAVERRVKHVLHCSTLLSNNKVDDTDSSGCVQWEGWYSPSDVFKLKNVGYPVSKFVSEVLMRRAAEELGVPVGVFRFPALFGSARSGGRFTLTNNHAATRLLGFCKLGALPAIPLPIQVLPSDVAAHLAVETFFVRSAVAAEEEDYSSGAFNLSNPHLNYFQDFAAVATEVGFPMDVLPFDQFQEKIKATTSSAGGVKGHELFPYGEVDLEEGKYVEWSTTPAALQAWLRNPAGFFVSRKMARLWPELSSVVEPPVETLKRDLRFAVRTGLAAKFGLSKNQTFA